MSTELDQVKKIVEAIRPLDEAAQRRAQARIDILTMPRGALGRLLPLARQLAGIQGKERPSVSRKVILTVAADHGVAAEGVSAFPQEVTAQMVANFVAGGAGVNVLARQVNARVVVADLGVAGALPVPYAPDRLLDLRVGPGTRNMAAGPAMSREEAVRAVAHGIRAAEAALGGRDGCECLGVGDMGIANTTAASAIFSVLTNRPPSEVTGRGTGVDDRALAKKIQVIGKALAVNRPDAKDPFDVLAKVGGFEIGGIAGACLAGAAARVPVVVDGFIATAGAALAVGIAPQVKPYLVASHRSAEPGHRLALEHLGLTPLLDLDLRLGEGTGAALAMHLLEAACRILTEMATFGEAKVTDAAPGVLAEGFRPAT